MDDKFQKELLTLKEAAEFFGLSQRKIRELTDGDDNPYVLWNGRKRLIKRKLFWNMLEESFSI